MWAAPVTRGALLPDPSRSTAGVDIGAGFGAE